MSKQVASSNPLVAIACGGTGGHLFPGVAVGEELLARGCDVLLIVSEKAIDRRAAEGAQDMEVVSLPAVGLGRNPLRFLAGLWSSRRAILKRFRERRPAAVLGMGGFTSAAPILAGRAVGARTFLHESNTIPGRANRWLARFVDQAFVWFPETKERWNQPQAVAVGTPVRGAFRAADPDAAREALGLDRDCPTLLVTGGSQGAEGINQAIVNIAPTLCDAVEGLQILHLTGARDLEAVSTAYAKANIAAITHAFLDDIPAALNAATLVVGRAGASSMAEIAAIGAPAILVPYPHAADNHQFHNAGAFVAAGAARMVEQNDGMSDVLSEQIIDLFRDPEKLNTLSRNVHRRHEPNAARRIAECILAATTHRQPADQERGACANAGRVDRSGQIENRAGQPRLGELMTDDRQFGACLCTATPNSRKEASLR